jgi:hypothetical protein
MKLYNRIKQVEISLDELGFYNSPDEMTHIRGMSDDATRREDIKEFYCDEPYLISKILEGCDNYDLSELFIEGMPDCAGIVIYRIVKVPPNIIDMHNRVARESAFHTWKKKYTKLSEQLAGLMKDKEILDKRNAELKELHKKD